MKKFYYIISVLMLLATACQQEDVCSHEDNVPVNVVYQVQMGDDLQSRALGDGKQVDELIVGIFRDETLITTKTFTRSGNGKFNNVSIPMMTKETYNLVFWAQKKDNAIYTIDNEFNVYIDYSKYNNITLTGTEQFEAFTTRKKNVSVDNPGDKNITLTRPFGQLNVGVAEGVDVSRVSKIEMAVKSIPTVYNPLYNSSSQVEDLDLVLKGSTVTEKLEIDNTNYTYLATVFMLPVSDTSVEMTIYQGIAQTRLNVGDVSLGANERTNIVGNLLK